LDYERTKFLDGCPEDSDDTASESTAGDPKKHKRPPKYMGLYGRSPSPAYFPAQIDWEKVLADPKAAIYIVESEKAACLLAKYGLAAIAIGGVNNHSAHKAGFHTLTPDLIRIATPGRPIIVVFDSDKDSKPQVLAAEGSLLGKLADRGAIALKLNIPAPLDGRPKNGPDDLIVERGIAAFSALEPERPGNLVEIYSLADMYGYLEDQDKLVRFVDCQLISEDHFHRQEAARRFFQPQANGGFKESQASRAFMKSLQRPNFQKLFYAPGEPRFLDGGFINRWTRSYEPIKGTVDKYLAVRDFTFKDSEPGVMHLVECLYAYKYQHPQAKIPMALFFFSDTQGSGKSLYGLLCCAAWGSGMEPTDHRCNFSKIEAKELSSNFNSRWSAKSEMGFGDEITARDKYVLDNELLKDMVTRTTMVVEEKYLKAYGARDYIFYTFTSNSPRSMRINAQDRRMLCVHAPEEKPRSGILPAGYDWLFKDPTCGPAMAYYWANFDYGDSNPFAETGAPWTKAKDEVIRANVSSVEEEIELLLTTERATLEATIERGYQWMRLDCCDLWSVVDFERHLARQASETGGSSYQRSPVTSNYIREVLKRHGARELPEPIKPPGERPIRVFAIRNQAKWLEIRANKDGGHRACVEEYMAGHIPPKEPKF